MDHDEVVDRGFLEMGEHALRLVEPTDKALDDVAAAIALTVKVQILLIKAAAGFRNEGLNAINVELVYDRS